MIPDKNGEFAGGKICKEGGTVVAAMPTEGEFRLPLEKVIIASAALSVVSGNFKLEK